eukprot:6205259-Pleurochrysis_carterae.AAC.2
MAAIATFLRASALSLIMCDSKCSSLTADRGFGGAKLWTASAPLAPFAACALDSPFELPLMRSPPAGPTSARSGAVVETGAILFPFCCPTPSSFGVPT